MALKGPPHRVVLITLLPGPFHKILAGPLDVLVPRVLDDLINGKSMVFTDAAQNSYQRLLHYFLRNAPFRNIHAARALVSSTTAREKTDLLLPLTGINQDSNMIHQGGWRVNRPVGVFLGYRGRIQY